MAQRSGAVKPSGTAAKGLTGGRFRCAVYSYRMQGALRAIAPGHSLTTPETFLQMRSHIQVISMHALIYQDLIVR